MCVCVRTCVCESIGREREQQGPWDQTDAKERVYFPPTMTDIAQLSKLTWTHTHTHTVFSAPNLEQLQ